MTKSAAPRKLIHFHSADSRFCGSAEIQRRFTFDPNEVTCSLCKDADTLVAFSSYKDSDTLTLSAQGQAYVDSLKGRRA